MTAGSICSIQYLGTRLCRQGMRVGKHPRRRRCGITVTLSSCTVDETLLQLRRTLDPFPRSLSPAYLMRQHTISIGPGPVLSFGTNTC